MNIETSEGLIEELGAQALATGAYQSPDAVTQSIAAVTHADVVNVSILPSLLPQVYGGLTTSPFRDALNTKMSRGARVALVHETWVHTGTGTLA